MRNLMFGGVAAALVFACPMAFAQTATPTPPPAQTQATPAPTASTSASTYTDTQLRAYATASVEVDRINAGLGGSATAAQRTQADTQIAAALQRNNLDRATFDGIAARARTDTTLSTRIASLRTPAPSRAPGQ